MPRPTREPPIVSSIVPVIVRHAAACEPNVDVDALALRFDLPVNAATLDSLDVAADVPNELLHAIARANVTRDIAFRLATKLSTKRHKWVELAARAAASGQDSLRLLARASPLVHEGLAADLSLGPSEARFTLRTPRRPLGVGSYIHELALSYALHQLRAGANAPIAAAHVWFAHPRPSTVDAVHTFFQTSNVTFGCEDSGFAIAAEFAHVSLPAADAGTLAALSPLIDAELGSICASSSLAARVEEILAAALPVNLDIADVGARLHMSARTLQRRFEDEGTKFTDVVERARASVARRLLADPTMKLDEIAYRVGFSDLATFSRAFKRWTGKPPGQWRRS